MVDRLSLSWILKIIACCRTHSQSTIRWESSAVVYLWQPAPEASVSFTTTMAAPQEVSVAVIASVISELESIFHWKESRELHGKLFLMEWLHLPEVGDSSHMTWLESDSSRKFEDLRLTRLTAMKNSAWLWLGINNLRLDLDLIEMTGKVLAFLSFFFLAHIETLV